MRFISLLILLALCALPKIWKETKGISARQCAKFLFAKEQSAPTNEAIHALAQPFTYWKKGSQSYVFLSADGRYVLKVPRSAKQGDSLLGRLLKKKDCSKATLKSFQIASSILGAETATLYAHCAPTNNLEKGDLRDLLGRSMPLDLNQLPFALQGRKELLSRCLCSENGKEILSAWLQLIEAEKEKGYQSTDHAFSLNFSYDGKVAQRIDIGSYQPLSSFSWQRVARPVVCFLRNLDPALQDWFKEEIRLRDEFYPVDARKPSPLGLG
jgi:hypothetical protein